MDYQGTLEVLCGLCTKVGSEVFNSSLAHDCFCGSGMGDFRSVDGKVLAFIVKAVNAAILEHERPDYSKCGHH